MRNLVFLLCCFVLTACSSSSTSTPPTPTIDMNSAAGRGLLLYQANCATCHALAPDVVVVGPSFAGIATRSAERVAGVSAEDYLRESIVEPDAYIVDGYSVGAMQQNFAMQLTSDEVSDILQFLLTLQ